MNIPANRLSLYSMIMHIAMGVTGLLRINLPPSWAQLFSLIPGSEWLYPISYIITGVVAGIGVRQPKVMQVGFWLSAGLFYVWGLLGIYSWLLGTGGNIIGASANFYIAGILSVLAHYVSVGKRSDRLNEGISRLQDQVDNG